MKKLFLYVFLGLLFCNVGFADNLKVIDGDTIVLIGEKIRFSGIDAPEYKQDCINGDLLIYCGMFSKVLLSKKIGNKLLTNNLVVLLGAHLLFLFNIPLGSGNFIHPNHSISPVKYCRKNV